MNKKGFTLIEILVAVLIIGILAAIAVPQYKLAVLKSEYSKCKEYAETIYGSVQIYYLTNGIWPKKLTDLDIELPGQLYSDDKRIRVLHKTDTNAYIWYDANGRNGYAACGINKVGTTVTYRHNYQEDNKKICHSGTDAFAAKLCQIETGKTSTNGYYYY